MPAPVRQRGGMLRFWITAQRAIPPPAAQPPAAPLVPHAEPPLPVRQAAPPLLVREAEQPLRVQGPVHLPFAFAAPAPVQHAVGMAAPVPEIVARAPLPRARQLARPLIAAAPAHDAAPALPPADAAPIPLQHPALAGAREAPELPALVPAPPHRVPLAALPLIPAALDVPLPGPAAGPDPPLGIFARARPRADDALADLIRRPALAVGLGQLPVLEVAGQLPPFLDDEDIVAVVAPGAARQPARDAAPRPRRHLSLEEHLLHLEGEHAVQLLIRAETPAMGPVFLNWARHLLPAAEDFRLSWDVDSFLCTAAFLPLASAVDLFPCPRFSNFLRKANHVKWPVGGEDVQISTIPNLAWAQVPPRGHMHIFFPAIRQQFPNSNRWKQAVDSATAACLYDEVVLPAWRALTVGSDRSLLPASYRAHLSNSTNGRGEFTLPTRPVPAALFQSLLLRMRAIVDAAPIRDWREPGIHRFRGFFLHLHAKDLKAIYRSPLRLSDAVRIFDERFALVPVAPPPPDAEVLIDVAVEISLPPCRGEHTIIAVMPYCEAVLGARLGATGFQRYPWCGSRVVGGLRATPGPASPRWLRFVQCYSTDKRALYNYQHHFRGMSIEEIASNSATFQSRIGGMRDTWSDYSACTFPLRLELRVVKQFAPAAAALLALVCDDLNRGQGADHFYFVLYIAFY